MNDELFVCQKSITFLFDNKNKRYHLFIGMSKRRRIKPNNEARGFINKNIDPPGFTVDNFGEKGNFTIKHLTFNK